MNITKVGHCCMVVETNNVRIVIDPGSWTTSQNSLKNIDIILVTHEHQDHFHLDSVRAILANNPQAVIVTNRGVGVLLDKESIPYQLLQDGQTATIKGVVIAGHGDKHAPIYTDIPSVTNTGYMIDNRFFYPGDALHDPKKPIEILALPVAAPWLKTSEAIDYALQLKPTKCFPVHDGMLKITAPYHMMVGNVIKAKGIEFVTPGEGEVYKY